MHICGIDEAGRGPLAGPVVVAAVAFHCEKNISGIKDSKKLSSRERERLYLEIVNKAADYKIFVINHKIIDEINILKAVMLGMKKCINLFDKEKHRFLIDGNYFKLENNEERNYNFETIVKGDDKIFEISCASILAKVTRDRIMKIYSNFFPEYLFERHKGYPTKMHIDIIKKSGITPIHRKSFCEKIFIANEICKK